ncbi:MAG: DUF5320 domain-containing protein [Candidatus Delongbacteria bacterium]|nr:DUF5320 domain-containing protein [Candidatus Delongbacteria bacterium]MCG2761107.1 DUF5320 domain-containing protein [Candidatus Delongbacteria bacterium]
MPRGDRTGPDGAGQMTGRGLGYCAGYIEPGYTAVGGRGYSFGGRGFGRGNGRRFGFKVGYDNVHNVSENTLFENEIRVLKDQLSSLEKRLDESQKEK